MPTYHNSRVNRFFNCGNCGEEVPRGRLACQGCGAEEKTGLYGLEDGYAAELPEENFDYNAFMKREFGTMRHIKPPDLPLKYWITGFLLLIALVLGLLIRLSRLGSTQE